MWIGANTISQCPGMEIAQLVQTWFNSWQWQWLIVSAITQKHHKKPSH